MPVPIIEKVERIIHKTVRVEEEKIVEVPKIEIVEKPVEEIVEIEQIEIVEKIVDVPVDQHVDVEVRVEKDVPVINDVSRFTPETYETVQPYKFILRGVGAEYQTQKMNIYIPRYVQVPIPSYLLTDKQKEEMRDMASMVERVARHPYPSLSDIETITTWLLERQNELKELQEKGKPTKQFIDQAIRRVPTNTPGDQGRSPRAANVNSADILEPKMATDVQFFSFPKLARKKQEPMLSKPMLSKEKPKA